jgi:hypothetical protein
VAKARLTRLQAWHLVNMAAGWMPILYGRRAQRATEGLLWLKLAASSSYPAEKGKAWSLVPTPLGEAMGALLVRRTGGKLKRAGVQALAEHSATLLERFNVEASVANLLLEQAAYDETGRELERRSLIRLRAGRG